MTRNGDIRKIKRAADASNARVFHSELFIFRRGIKASTFAVERASIFAVNHAQMRSKSEPHHPAPFPLNDANVNGLQIRIAFPIDDNTAFFPVPARQRGLAAAALGSAFGHT